MKPVSSITTALVMVKDWTKAEKLLPLFRLDYASTLKRKIHS